jgi:ankyrin repeat protein
VTSTHSLHISPRDSIRLRAPTSVTRCITAPAGTRAAAKALVAAGAAVVADRFLSRAPLVGAIEFGDADLAAYLLECGAPANHSEGAYTPLMAAAEHGELAVVVALLDRGARVEVSDRFGATALHLALESRDLRLAGGRRAAVVAALVCFGADPLAEDAGGATPIYLARVLGHEDVIGALEAQRLASTPP